LPLYSWRRNRDWLQRFRYLKGLCIGKRKDCSQSDYGNQSAISTWTIWSHKKSAIHCLASLHW